MEKKLIREISPAIKARMKYK